MFSPLLHRLGLLSQRPAHRRFCRALRQPESAQRVCLRAILASVEGTEQAKAKKLDAQTPYEEFIRRVPLSRYEDLAAQIQMQRDQPQRPILARRILRFAPTSGSTSAHKWVPITPQLGRELDAAAAAWLVDLAFQYPAISDGPHYWSLSWLPDALRAQGGSSDDLDSLPRLRRWLLSRIMAVPGEIARLRTSEGARLATLVHLAARPSLRLISVWSPTFLLRLLEDLGEARGSIASILERGRWEAAWSPDLGALPAWRPPRSPRVAKWLRAWDGSLSAQALASLWPRLALISAWDSSTSASFALPLKSLFPRVPFQGKGLWATEGVVTIPFAGHYPLALTSHLLEFRALDSGEVIPSWRLRVGQEVQPVISTGSGLLRYVLADRLVVTNPLANGPCIRFLGRIQGVDLVGEKMDARLAERVLSNLERSQGLRAVSLLAVVPQNARPRYVVLVEDPEHGDADSSVSLALAAEKILQTIHHYRLARELHQLEAAAVIATRDGLTFYERLVAGASAIQGGLKLESVVRVDGASAEYVLSILESSRPTERLEEHR